MNPARIGIWERYLEAHGWVRAPAPPEGRWVRPDDDPQAFGRPLVCLYTPQMDVPHELETIAIVEGRGAGEVCVDLMRLETEVDHPECLADRAGGDCICPACGREYRRHPLDPRFRSWDGQPYLNRLCDGRLVKL